MNFSFRGDIGRTVFYRTLVRQVAVDCKGGVGLMLRLPQCGLKDFDLVKLHDKA